MADILQELNTIKTLIDELIGLKDSANVNEIDDKADAIERHESLATRTIDTMDEAKSVLAKGIVNTFQDYGVITSRTDILPNTKEVLDKTTALKQKILSLQSGPVPPAGPSPSPAGPSVGFPGTTTVTITGELANGKDLTMKTIKVVNGATDETYTINGEIKPQEPAKRTFLDFVNTGQKIAINTGAAAKKGWFSGGRTKKYKKRYTKRRQSNKRKTRR